MDLADLVGLVGTRPVRALQAQGLLLPAAEQAAPAEEALQLVAAR